MGRSIEDRFTQVGLAVLSVLRCEPRIVRWMPGALLVIAIGLGAWVLELGAVLVALAVWSVRPGAGAAR